MSRMIWRMTSLMVLLFCLPSTVAAITLEEVRERGVLHCGVTAGRPGFAATDEAGTWSGINVEFCRAVAAAVLGEADSVKYVPVSGANRFTALQSGDVDLLVTTIPWTLTSDTALGLSFTGVLVYDGLSFLSETKRGITSGLELDGATVCLEKRDAAAAERLASFFSEHNMSYRPVFVDGPERLVIELASGQCPIVSGVRTDLYSLRLQLDRPGAYTVLPEVISRRPLGPIVRQGDDAWFNIVRWTLFAMVIAEERGLDSQHVDEMKAGGDPAISGVRGGTERLMRGLGLSDDWIYQVVRQVGNYGEIFDRTLGKDSRLGMERGINNLWNRGGLHYAPLLE